MGHGPSRKAHTWRSQGQLAVYYDVKSGDPLRTQLRRGRQLMTGRPHWTGGPEPAMAQVADQHIRVLNRDLTAGVVLSIRSRRCTACAMDVPLAPSAMAPRS